MLLETRLARAQIYSRTIIITKKSGALRNLLACHSVSWASGYHGRFINKETR
jgi:hypothetical protein